MHLRALSIRGFKSFANKSILRFEPGITVIVGPNGSGKSNITDSVLWVLGEQSAKTLRGSSMEDVIFSGSANKKALGAAEVSLTLDNSDGVIPIDFSEVTITRRLYRSGESEYLINRTACRLIDIQEILSDTGLGREMYSVISQGRLDDALNCKPRERRQLLEEAAGVLKHKKRRDRALRKLGAMGHNLTRGQDILREVNRQLSPLQKQADMALEHARLTEELKEAQVAGAVGRLRRLRGQWEHLAADHETKQELIETINLGLQGAQTRIDELEAELEEKGELSGDISEYRRQFAGLRERINSGLLLLEEKGKNLIAKISELRQSIYNLESRASASRRERDKLLEEKEKLDAELAALYQRLNKERRETETVKKSAKQTAEALAEVEIAFNQARERRIEINREIDRRRSLIESTTEKTSFLREQLAAVSKKSDELAAELAKVEAERAELEPDLPELEKRVSEAAENVEERRRAGDAARDRLEGLTSELGEARAKTAALEAVESSVRRGFAWFDSEKDKFPEIRGSVSDLVNVDQKYERAVEAVLGPDVLALIAADRSGADRLYRRAKERGDEPVRVWTPGKIDLLEAGEPDLKWAPDAIECADVVKPAVEALLGHVWIIDELTDFIAAGRRAPRGGLVVDRSGDYIDGRGLIVRQERGDAAGSIAAKRELSSLKQDIERLTGAVAAARGELEGAGKEISRAEEATRTAQTQAHKLDGRVMAASLRAQNLKRDLDRLNEQKSAIESGLAEAEKTLSEANDSLGGLEKKLDEADREIKDREAEYAEKKADRTAADNTERQATAGLSEVQVTMASLTERQTHWKTRLISVTDELERAEKVLKQQNTIATATEELRHRIQPVHDLYSALRLAAEGRAHTLEAMDDREQCGAAVLREELRALHQRGRDLNADLKLANSELVGKAEQKTQVETEVGQITRMLVDELGMALETALAFSEDGREPEDWAVKERRIKDRLARMGPVNQIAADEFAKLQERQTFLSGQIDDLIKSQKALKKVIKAIDDKITDRFKQTFEEVNNNFNLMFQELFPGGSAGLVLIEDEEDEEAGVEIEAQPEGKRLKSLSLLSGGERSLVGLALMFALHCSRPSPFYILDEVEAALDMINLQRFIRLMNKLKTKTQFLVITHQRPTMDIADSVYGVSMQADGISKVISQKLEPEEFDDGRRDEVGLVAAAVQRPEEIQDQP